MSEYMQEWVNSFTRLERGGEYGWNPFQQTIIKADSWERGHTCKGFMGS